MSHENNTGFVIILVHHAIFQGESMNQFHIALVAQFKLRMNGPRVHQDPAGVHRSTWNREKGCSSLLWRGNAFVAIVSEALRVNYRMQPWETCSDLWNHAYWTPEIFNTAGIPGIAVFLTFSRNVFICVDCTTGLASEQFLNHVNKHHWCIY